MKIHVVVGVIVQSGKILICQRPKHRDHGNQWEFPGGKIKANENLLEALHRELEEEIGIIVSKAFHFYSTEHHYPDKYVRLECFLVTQFQGIPECKEGQPKIRWSEIEHLPQYDFPEANYKIIDQLLRLVSPMPDDPIDEIVIF
ncbi:8-oxo-dGTP diphosphatase MutT [Legionella sp. W05-934-2]|jgi:8-oxo-dGTP diphosphatase|uniref:8-oxo-dGTP diphosphatase MutT n=1 Tax=Legionella sp. W05-934-2 TaxID=1198649 RepID=UPI0034628058